MRHPPITEHPEALAKFKGSAERGYFTDALQLLHDYTIDEPTIEALQIPNLLQEVRLFADSYEPQLGRKILLGAAREVLPNVHTNARAAYQLNHYDHFEQFGQALHVLERFRVRAASSDISSEFAEWAKARSTAPEFAARIAQHIELKEKH